MRSKHFWFAALFVACVGAMVFGLGTDRTASRLSDGPQFRGDVIVTLYGPDGAVKDHREFHNLIVTVGAEHIADQLADQGEAQMGWMAIGFGTTAPAAGNTTLENEQDRNALDATYPLQQSAPNAHKVDYKATFGAGEGTGAVTEAGIFNAAAAGTLLCRQTFSAINKGAADSLSITWTITCTPQS